jgi:hypothetical protein
MKEAAYGLEFWGRKFGLRSKCGVTFCLLGNAQKGLRQIFKLGPNCLVSALAKSLAAFARQLSAADIADVMSFYASY